MPRNGLSLTRQSSRRAAAERLSLFGASMLEIPIRKMVPAALAVALSLAGAAKGVTVRRVRVPEGGIQPQVVVDGRGTLHLIYYRGEARQGDVFYVYSRDGGASFSSPIRVNSQKGSAVAAGTIRGAQLAAGRGGRVHVVWNGSAIAVPKGPRDPENPAHPSAPMLYTRLDDSGRAFEPQRNLMRRTYALDGGGSVAADAAGRVYVAWHGKAPGAVQGEAGRSVWIARSVDDGRTFSPERPAWGKPTGSCACCSLRCFAGGHGRLFLLYRSATEQVHRDIFVLVSKDRGDSFRGGRLHPWQVSTCPMSSMALAEGPQGVVGAWETQGQVYVAWLDAERPEQSQPVAAPGPAQGRKHPALAVNQRGETILVWTEGTGWGKGGSLAWQVFGRDGGPLAQQGREPGIPAWSFAAVFADPDGNFVILY
ncbi:MAG TPA: sialidase family protein [Bryobacteraceae bacterium]|nr:sialidase family protein [Bryobacteraceae bacterium]